MAKAKKFRWGILGCANIACKSFIPEVQSLNKNDILAIASRNLAKAKRTAKKFDIPRAYGSYDELLADPDVDGIYIPLPNHMHCEWSIKATNAGKHVLCEKPLALNPAEVKRMIAAAKKNNVYLMEAYIQRFHPQWEYVRKTIKAGKIGKPRLLNLNYSFKADLPKNDYRWLPEMGGGSLFDVGCYCVVAARMLFNAEPIRIEGWQHLDREGGIDMTTTAVLEFPGDRYAIMDSSFEALGRRRVTIQGPKGYIFLTVPWLPRTEKPTVEVVSNGKKTTYAGQIMKEYGMEAAYFADCVRKRKKLAYPPSDAVASLKIMNAITKSARTGKAVRL